MHGLGGGRRPARQRASSDPRVMMDRDSITRTGARAPGVERIVRLNGGAQAHNCPDTERGCTGLNAMSATEGCKPEGRDNWAPTLGRHPSIGQP
jgi:hypothetical protein